LPCWGLRQHLAEVKHPEEKKKGGGRSADAQARIGEFFMPGKKENTDEKKEENDDSTLMFWGGRDRWIVTRRSGEGWGGVSAQGKRGSRNGPLSESRARRKGKFFRRGEKREKKVFLRGKTEMSISDEKKNNIMGPRRKDRGEIYGEKSFPRSLFAKRRSAGGGEKGPLNLHLRRTSSGWREEEGDCLPLIRERGIGPEMSLRQKKRVAERGDGLELKGAGAGSGKKEERGKPPAKGERVTGK